MGIWSPSGVIAGLLLSGAMTGARVVPAAIFPPNANAAASSAVQPLVAFRDSDVKFDVAALMDLLRDRRHEGWVLAAYADPVTHRPLIGAGVSLDLPERVHPQLDPANPNPFLEPSSAELWQAAGLDPGRLDEILAGFQRGQASAAHKRTSRGHRRRPRPVTPQISDEEASRLLRIAVIQAIENARAYCRDFDQLTASQQMAVTQLVYQMGFNLVEFNQFLTLMNDASNADLLLVSPADFETEHWRAAQSALIESQWARLFRERAVSVIAMLDPHYAEDPAGAEARVNTQLNAEFPPVVRPAVARRRHRAGPALRNASERKRSARHGQRQTALDN